jgi:hypothetical protein
MRFHDNGAFYSVSVSAAELRDFAPRWPCSGMRSATRGLWFQFDKRNGDLVDIKGERKAYDDGAVRALSFAAQRYGEPFTRCTNCGGPLPTGHGCHSRSRPRRWFCDNCAGLGEALNVGNPKTRALFLYDDGKGNATAWTGPVVGKIVHKRKPDLFRLAAIRYRVRMLDGSMWHGYGPSANGTYMRLRRMAK